MLKGPVSRASAALTPSRGRFHHFRNRRSYGDRAREQQCKYCFAHIASSFEIASPMPAYNIKRSPQPWGAPPLL